MSTPVVELPWHIVEKAIATEKEWLLRVFDFGQQRKTIQEEHDVTAPLSPDQMLRQISISILRGNIRVRELISEKINGLWMENSAGWELDHTEERHGGEWHRAMMSIIKKHFVENGFEVTNEPHLTQGRADLGVYKKGHANIYVEVGSTSLFKTWINLHTMPNSIFLFVPSENYALEFSTSHIPPAMSTHPTPMPKKPTNNSIP